MTQEQPFRFTPGQVGQMIGASVQTVRRWSETFADQLSASTQEKPRLYTWQDIEILKKIKALRDQGVAADDITASFQGPASLPASMEGQIAPQIDQAAPTEVPALPIVLDAINAINRRVDGLERGRMAITVAFGLGFVCAGLMFLLLIELARLYAK